MTNLSKTISFFLPNFNCGGVQRLVLNLSYSLSQQKNQIDLVLIRSVGSFMSQIPPSVNLVDLKKPRLRQAIQVLGQYLREKNPDALFSFMSYNDPISVLAKSLYHVKTKIILGLHSDLSQQKTPPFLQHPLAHLGLTPDQPKLLMQWFYPWANAVVAPSYGVANNLAQMAKFPLEKIRVIYNPVITPEIFEKQQQMIQHPWFEIDQPPVILGVGRLIPHKDFFTLIRAFAKVKEQISCRLVILGEGEMRRELEKLVQALNLTHDVDLLGFTDNPYAYMKQAKVFVLSSNCEGFGNVLVEAMTCGTPVVSTDCHSGPREILNHGKYGHLVPVGDAGKMAQAIVEVLTGNSKKFDINWLNQFTLDTVTQKYIDLLN
ncbi:glycosyltransferase [Spirulina subsalsa FACHB-351]|uniref:Glycosyltransferase n=1 Tax=Spirulina subsalsa FACHB-351 TaxID=234711 RepID=A0ABT3L115_9CYAN|nr:glycosyltransferase [Spirulina subsalsa]MCW6035182.1 glycosyltransferase [Spirulina subsalsa FACHB-351]